jgi:hypothetical protein
MNFDNFDFESAFHIHPLLLIFLASLIFILLVRIVFSLLFFVAKIIYANSVKTAQFLKNDVKKFIKEDEELLRKLDEIPKAHSATRAGKIGKPAQDQSYELIPSEEQQQEKKELSEVKIVDVVKPVGFWTSMILGQKLTYLIQSAQIINKQANKGFWASMIEAQEQAQGRERGRTR